MLPIPAFNPGDTTIYPNGNGVINVGAADAGAKMLLYNESPFNINIDFLNGNQSILHAWEARYWTLDGDTRQVEWDINSSLNVTSSPISLVIGELYGAREKLEGTYPMGLIRQTNVGNPGGIVSSASTIINDGNALLQVIEATLSGHASSDVIINNNGSFTLKGAGLLAAVGLLVEILGNLKVDGTSEFVGAATFDAAVNATGTIFANGGVNTNTLRDDTNGNTALDMSAGTGAVALLHLLTLAAAGITVPALTDFLIPMPGTANKWSLTMGGTAQYAMDFTKLSCLNGNGLSVAGASTFTGAATFTADPRLSTGRIADGSGNNIIDASTGGMVARGQHGNNNRFTYQGDGVDVDWFINAQGGAVVGSASATVNHGLKQFGASVAPTNFIMNPSTGGGSQTFGFNTITATQVNVVLGATNAYSFNPIRW